ncbi:hypothetical protein MTO96_012145 [Rhipicephalus appendiculatus]
MGPTTAATSNASGPSPRLRPATLRTEQEEEEARPDSLERHRFPALSSRSRARLASPAPAGQKTGLAKPRVARRGRSHAPGSSSVHCQEPEQCERGMRSSKGRRREKAHRCQTDTTGESFLPVRELLRGQVVLSIVVTEKLPSQLERR